MVNSELREFSFARVNSDDGQRRGEYDSRQSVLFNPLFDDSTGKTGGHDGELGARSDFCRRRMPHRVDLPVALHRPGRSGE
jgi:hypothetical protein